MGEREVSEGEFVPVSHRLTGSALYEWLTARLHSAGYDQAYFWAWDHRKQVLAPRALMVPPALDREIAPGPLRLGQGFVGRCAADLKTVVEHQIEDGRGATTGIRTPYPRLRKQAPLRSIFAHPVFDSNRLYGVLAVVSDSPGEFAGHDHDPRMVQITGALREHLQAADQRTVENLQREIAHDLLSSLSQPDDPTKFWTKLDRILRQLESRGLYRSCAVYAAEPGQAMQYSCKAASPHAAEQRSHSICADDHAEFRDLLALPEGVFQLDDLFQSAPVQALLKTTGVPYWVMHYPDQFERGSEPMFIAIAALEPESPYNGAFGARAARTALTQVFGGVFSAARAILTASDTARQGNERMQIFSAATHDLRAPVASLRHYADSLTDLTGENARAKGHILRLADDAILRIENVLYEWWATDQKNPSFAALDPWEFLAEIVIQINANIPDKVILPANDGTLSGYVLRAHALSLNLALKNVLDNAIKFGKEAPVHVKIRAGEAPAGSPVSHKLTIEVRDHGIGIPVESRRAVFEYGYRTEHSRKHVVKGAGVGLSITRSIVESHGGSIWVDAAVPPSAGTSMVIVLPLNRRS
jgi:signal transduction histidine kinase